MYIQTNNGPTIGCLQYYNIFTYHQQVCYIIIIIIIIIIIVSYYYIISMWLLAM